MLKVWSIQEPKLYYLDSVRYAKRAAENIVMHDDATLILKSRYEKLILADQPQKDIPGAQYHSDWSLRDACEDVENVLKAKCPDNLMSKHRQFMPSGRRSILSNAESDITSVIKVLASQPENCPQVGLAGPPGSG